MAPTFHRLEIPAVVLVQPRRHADPRGQLVETYRRSAYVAVGIEDRFVQTNVVRSRHGALRGLHYQLPPAAQGKLVGVARGRIFDVAVDLRAGPTLGRWVGRILDAETGAQLWIPAGFAHGYCVLSDEADVVYQATAEYDPDLDRGIRWNDPEIGVRWPEVEPVLSARDRALPALRDAENPFAS